MRDACILANGTLLTDWENPRIIQDGGVAWHEGRILEVGGSADMTARYPQAAVLDARGGFIGPGLVNVHHHFYSALARGLDPGGPLRSFPEVLDRLWWRLDRALDEEAVRVSALLSAASCVQSGCTTVFDHHASPSSIEGSLDVIAEALEEAGLSALLCYEVTDRNGHAGALAGIEENLRFLSERRAHPRIRGVFGLHASFTVRDETLELVARRRPEGAGCHIHLGEDPVDNEASLEAFGVGAVERLARTGLLDDRALLAHGIHLEEDDYRRVAEAGATIIHNPESNANNGVGRLDVPAVSDLGCRVALGTDGMSSDVIRSLQFAFLSMRGATGDPSAGFRVLPGLLPENTRIARDFLGEPLLGELVPGAPADLITLDSVAPTPVTTENFFGHLVYGVSHGRVRHTVARGEILMEDFRHRTLDPLELGRRAREVAPALWDRFHALDWNTPFLGPETEG